MPRYSRFAFFGILAHHSNHAIGRQIAVDRRPRRAAVGRAIEVVAVVVAAVIVERDVDRVLRVARRLDARHVAGLRQVRQAIGDRQPGLAGVARDLQIAVIGADPQHAAPQRRFGDRRDGGVVGHAIVQRQRRFGGQLRHHAQRRAIDGGGPIAERHPGLPAIGRSPQLVRPGVEDPGIVGREEDRRVPVRRQHGVPELGLGHARLAPRVPVAASGDRAARVSGTDVDALARHEIETRQAEILRARVERAVVGRIDDIREAVAASGPHPVIVQHARGVERGARSGPAPVVLQAAVDPERLPHVGADSIELADRQARHVKPGRAAIVRDADAAIVALDQVTSSRADRSRRRGRRRAATAAAPGTSCRRRPRR